MIARQSGRAQKPDHIPTKLERQGVGPDKVALVDIDDFSSCLLVNQTFKDILKELEPGVHQFWPMELYIKGEKIGDAYWLNICNRLDTMHRGLTYPVNERGFWVPTKGKPSQFFFDVQKIGVHHAWHDKFRGGTFISEEFAARLQAAGVTGLSYQHLEQA